MRGTGPHPGPDCPSHRLGRRTFNALSRDLSALYRSAATGERSGLGQLPLQYGDFAHWQHATWTDERLAEHLDHWRTALVPAPRPLALPTDAPRSARPTAHGDRRFHTFAPDVTDRLTAFARAPARPPSWCCSPGCRPCFTASPAPPTSRSARPS
ncbi:condensation domain-containing protein [Streptomyces sp. MS1.AVA.1]|uniref:Condensation domain-containing protein n=1 Tax=Streptomyces machairae TaxID=3134109 RepID=A0ABU8UH09_9ACTN